MIKNRPIYRYNTNPLQNNEGKKEIGIEVNFSSDKNIFKSTYTTKDQVKNQIINYILTDPGERLFNPNFGSGIRSLLFEQITDDTLNAFEDSLHQGLQTYIQYINVNNIIIEPLEDQNSVNVIVDYSINNQKESLTLQVTE